MGQTTKIGGLKVREIKVGTRQRVASPGLYVMDEAEYHADTRLAKSLGPSVSSSELREALKAPALVKFMRENPRKSTSAQEAGALAHTMVLGVGPQPVEIPAELLAKNGAVSTQKAKDWVAEQEALGNIPKKAHELVPIRAMADAILANPIARSLIEEEGASELSAYADQGETVMRARFDRINKDGTRIVDLKTAQSAHPHDFSRQAANLGYDIQAATYEYVAALLGLDVQDFVHIVVESKPPYLVAVYRFDDESKRWGYHLMERALNKYLEAKATDTWPSYEDGWIAPLSTPAYHRAA